MEKRETCILFAESRETLAAEQSKRKRNKKTTYFPVMAKITNDKEFVLNSVMNLVKDSEPTSTAKEASAPPAANENQSEESNCLSLFGNREDVLRLLDTESENSYIPRSFITKSKVIFHCLFQSLLTRRFFSMTQLRKWICGVII